MVVAAVLAGVPATAKAEPVRAAAAGLTEQVAGSRTVIHYATTGTDVFTREQAERLVAVADDAVPAAFDATGFPAPPSDGDGKIDVYIRDPRARHSDGSAAYGSAPRDAGPVPSGYVLLSPTVITHTDPWFRKFFIHELHHLAQGALAPDPTRLGLGWLKEATSEWAVDGVDRAQPETKGPIIGPYLAHTGLPLDCHVPAPCMTGRFDKEGYDRWHVLRQLERAYGTGFVRAWWGEIAAAVDQSSGLEIRALATALAARGATLGDGFTALALGNLQGVDVPWGFGARPKATAALTIGATEARVVQTVDHLAIENVGLSRSTCLPGRLRLEVDVPADAGSSAVFWQDGSEPVVVRGGRADLPWLGCATALVSLPNGSAAADDLPFTVRATVTAVTSRQDAAAPKVTKLRVVKKAAQFTSNAALPAAISVSRRSGKRWVKVGGFRRSIAVGKNRVSLTRYLKRGGRYRVFVFPIAGTLGIGDFVTVTLRS